jgi:hypothetical protein
MNLTNSPLSKEMLTLRILMDSSLSRAMAFEWINHLALVIMNSPLTKEMLKVSKIMDSAL